MFAWLRNKFLNCLTCSLRINIKENIIIEASLCFPLIPLPLCPSNSRGAFAVSEHVGTTQECAALEGVYTTGAWAASELVCTTEGCAAPGGVYTTGAWAESERVCTTQECAAPGGVYTKGAWAASERVCITEGCAAPGGVYTTRAWAASECVCTTEGCAALQVSTPQGPELHLNVSTPRSLSCTWKCLHYRGVSSISTLLVAFAAAGLVYTTEACAASGHVNTLGPELHLGVVRLLVACAAAGLVYTTEACAPSGHVYTLGPELHLDVSNLQGPVPTYCRMCSLCFKNNFLTVGRVCFAHNFLIVECARFASKLIFFLSNVFVLLQK